MTLKNRLVQFRKNAGLSQEDVAEKLDVTRQTVSKWETGQSSPDLDKVLPLCELYNITPDELLRGEEARSEESNDKADTESKINYEENRKKRAKGIGIGVMGYILSIVSIMISVPVLHMNPIIAAGIMMFIIALSTANIVYVGIAYKVKEDKPKRERTKEDIFFKHFTSVLALIFTIAYLGISFFTFAWHITWLIWIVYALVIEVIKLIILLVSGKEVDDEDD